jgi:dihydropteroate synthase
MGVLNVTPDSFSDGGLHKDPQAAIAHGLALLDEGADILDIGGESTRPGSPTASSHGLGLAGAVSAEQELARVLPVIESLRQQRPDAILSIDTYKSSVARAALDAGVEIVNDVSGFTWDTAMSATIAERPCGAILMHVRGRPHEWRTQPPPPDIVALVLEKLRDRLSDALDAGIQRRSIVLDPGFGFGKNFSENYPLLAHFEAFHTLGLPLLAAVSRKSFLGHTVSDRLAQLSRFEDVENVQPECAPHLPGAAAGAASSAAYPTARPSLADVGSLAPPPTLPPAERDNATLAAIVAAALAGAHIVRVHAVRPAVEALAIADAILAAE